MLGRKQSVRNNEDWKNALDHIEETVSKKELDSLVKKTVKDIKEKCKGKKAAYAWSAGKDSLSRQASNNKHKEPGMQMTRKERINIPSYPRLGSFP